MIKDRLKTNQRIKRMKQESFSSAVIKSFKGKHLHEIAEWYPYMIDEHDVIDYLIQCQEYDMLPMIAKYEKDPDSIDTDFDAKSGLLCFCEVIQELSKRVCYSLFEAVDDWLYTSDRKYINARESKKQLATDYKQDLYKDFIDEDVGGKRFITKYEFEKFLDDCYHKRIISSIEELPFSDDSLYLMLYQHQEEYNLDKYKILTTIIPKGQSSWHHEGAANDYLKYEPYLKAEYGRKDSLNFGKDMILDHFLDPVQIIG